MTFRSDHEEQNMQVKTFDPFVYALTMIDEPHRLIHDGMVFTASAIETSLADDSSLDILLSCGEDCRPHVRELTIGISDAPVEIRFFEDVTTSDDGTEVTAYNRNRNSSNTPGLDLFTGPTVTDTGTEIFERLLPAQGGGPVSGGTLDTAFNEEWIYAPETKYLIRITNTSGSTINIGWTINWYEVSYA